MTNRPTSWMRVRCVLALLLAVTLAGASIAHNGFRLGNAVCTFAYVAFALASIYVAMWKQWDFEIVGWALLTVFIVGMVMS